MRRRFSRRRTDTGSTDINITAFMNLMVILVPFLLITAVFTRITVLDLNIPPANSRAQETPEQQFALEITVRKNGIEVGDRNGGLLKRINPNGDSYDYEQLSQLLQQIKARFPERLDATILLESDIAYDTLVQVIDRVRVTQVVSGGAVQSAELFPDISIGDAPVNDMKVASK